MATRVERAVDDYEIRAVLARYCRGVDRLDAELLRTCFHASAQEIRDGVALSRDEFVAAMVERSSRRYESVMHFLGNVHIEFFGADAARTETYVVAYSIGVDRTDPAVNRTVGVRYVDDFERRTGREWRIAHRTVVFDWISRHPLELPSSEPRGQRDRTDASYPAR